MHRLLLDARAGGVVELARSGQPAILMHPGSGRERLEFKFKCLEIFLIQAGAEEGRKAGAYRRQQAAYVRRQCSAMSIYDTSGTSDHNIASRTPCLRVPNGSNQLIAGAVV